MAKKRRATDEQEEESNAAPVADVSSVRLLVDKDENCPFQQWFRSLRDAAAKARILSRLARIVNGGNFGDHRERIKGAVSELRVDYGPGYRIYYAKIGDVIVVLLGGGTKDTQQADIEIAFALWEGNKNEDDRFSAVFGG